MKEYIILFLKGMAMGIANVIPGVSGGTIALITQIYERLINSLKSFDRKALKLIISGNFSSFIKYTDLYFLLSIFGGSIASVFSIANLFKYLFLHYPILIWAFFFGLIIASVFFVGKRVQKWEISNIIALIIGATIAVSLSFVTQGDENSNLFFVFLCGIIGISGMMLPGLSGSFILILMGNYELLMVTAVADLDIILLGVFCLGSIFGLMSFSHLLAWIFKHYKDITLALLTGFILGSLNITWPWKANAKSIVIDGQEKIIDYNRYIPSDYNLETILAVILIILGIITVYYLESFETKKKR